MPILFYVRRDFLFKKARQIAKIKHKDSLAKLPPKLTLSFFSLVFVFPWCFSCCGNPWSFEVFSAYFPGFLRVRKVRKSLVFSRFSFLPLGAPRLHL